MIAALYVQTGGCYFGLPGVDPYDKKRDARLYAGPYPVVAHPPCERWGRYWGGGPMLHGTPRQKRLGDDGGCFAAALESVRTWGGVLEHPEGSHAWRAFELNLPPRSGGWVNADFYGGRTCCVEQGAYGHRARKATWLYAARVNLPSLRWGRANGSFDLLDDGARKNARNQQDVRRTHATNATCYAPLPGRRGGSTACADAPSISGPALPAVAACFRAFCGAVLDSSVIRAHRVQQRLIDPDRCQVTAVLV